MLEVVRTGYGIFQTVQVPPLHNGRTGEEAILTRFSTRSSRRHGGGDYTLDAVTVRLRLLNPSDPSVSAKGCLPSTSIDREKHGSWS